MARQQGDWSLNDPEIKQEKTIKDITEMDSVGFEYFLMKELYNGFNTTILSRELNLAPPINNVNPNLELITKVVRNLLAKMISLVVAHTEQKNKTQGNIYTPAYLAEYLRKTFFKDIPTEGGQTGIAKLLLLPTQGGKPSFTSFKNPYELIDMVLPKMNIRELMTMVKNFQRSENDCIMYEVILTFKEVIKYSDSTGKTDMIINFFKIYYMLSFEEMMESIKRIENILGFPIEETYKCYTRNDKTGQLEDRTAGCTEDNMLYNVIQKEVLEKHTTGPIPVTLCYLWHPLIYGIPYQDVIKLQDKSGSNPVQNMLVSFVPEKDTAKLEKCVKNLFSEYPIVPPLSENELIYVSEKGNKFVDMRFSPTKPTYCYLKAKSPESLTLKVRRKYDVFSVGNISGHTILFLQMAKYFTGIDLKIIMLACILYMVPYNHSINEIFQAGKLMNVFPDYNITVNIYEALQRILMEDERLVPLSNGLLFSIVNDHFAKRGTSTRIQSSLILLQENYERTAKERLTKIIQNESSKLERGASALSDMGSIFEGILESGEKITSDIQAREKESEERNRMDSIKDAIHLIQSKKEIEQRTEKVDEQNLGNTQVVVRQQEEKKPSILESAMAMLGLGSAKGGKKTKKKGNKKRKKTKRIGI